MTQADERIAAPVDVNVKNWAPQIKPPYVKKTTIRTYVIDPTGATGVGKFVQIGDYEPNRMRIAIIVSDFPVSLTTDTPVASPDTSTVSVAPQGAYLPVNANATPYELFGPDAFWLNSIATSTAGRVTVIKEFC